ncbi:hypothetical protein HN777_00535 [Candidatus Woesearchaeota archaeon]|nr:hypothetical protein [Candidatus Woesearchaeota archaeon]MBT7402261.1 hypothetical protein [Candidatus Woesearchaeota archaeon]
MFDDEELKQLEILRKKFIPKRSIIPVSKHKAGEVCDICKRKDKLMRIDYNDLTIKPEYYFNYYWMCSECINKFKTDSDTNAPADCKEAGYR